MVALTTQPPSRSTNGETSVPPPAKLTRRGALARMTFPFTLLLFGRRRRAPPEPTPTAGMSLGVRYPRTVLWRRRRTLACRRGWVAPGARSSPLHRELFRLLLAEKRTLRR